MKSSTLRFLLSRETRSVAEWPAPRRKGPFFTMVLARLRPDVSELSAMMMASRFYLNFFTVEILFGVPNHFGKPSDDVVRETAEILRHGMLNPGKAGG